MAIGLAKQRRRRRVNGLIAGVERDILQAGFCAIKAQGKAEAEDRGWK